MSTTSSGAADGAAPAVLPDWLFIACGLSWGAGLIHVSAAVGHLHASQLYALCFALLAPLQLAWGFLVCRRCTARLLIAGVVLSLGVVSVWGLSRTLGLPIGPDPWRPEAVGLVDSIATADELTLCLVVWIGVGRGRGVVGAAAKAGAVVLIILSSMALLGAGHAS